MALAQLALATALQVSREIHVLLQREVVCLLVVPIRLNFGFCFIHRRSFVGMVESMLCHLLLEQAYDCVFVHDFGTF